MPYGGFVPATRSGLTGKMGMPGDMGNLVGEGGSIGTGLSLSFANLAVLMQIVAMWVLSFFCGGMEAAREVVWYELGTCKQNQSMRLPCSGNGRTGHENGRCNVMTTAAESALFTPA